MMQKIGFYSLGPGTLLFLINTGRWLVYELWPVVASSLRTQRGRVVSGPITDQHREEARLLYSGAFVISILTCILFLGIDAATANAIANWTPNQVMFSNIAYITFELALSVLAMRTVKFEMVQSLVRGLVAL